MTKQAVLPLLAGFLFCFGSLAEIPDSREPSIQEALAKAWNEVQAIKHPLLAKASAVKPSFMDAGHGLVSAEVDYAVNAKWNPKGARSTSADPVPIDSKRPFLPFLFIRVSVYRPSPLSQPHVRSRGFRVGDIDYNVLITVASSDNEFSKRIEFILNSAFDYWRDDKRVSAIADSPPVAEAHPMAHIANDLRKILQPSWKLTSSTNVIRIESKEDVWLLYPSLPGREANESDDHYARKNGYKTKYKVALNFVPRLTDVQLQKIREERRPLERAVEQGAGDKRKFSEAVNALEKHPLPMFYTDDGYSIFVDWPYGSCGVHPPDAAAQVEQLVLSLRKFFHEYNYPPPALVAAGTLVDDPVKAIKRVLPQGWAILKVEHNTYPNYRPEGHGTAIFLGIVGKKYFKQDYSAVVYIMPADYQDGGEDPTDGKAASWPPRLVAITKNAKIYLWPDSEAEDWRTMEKDLLRALSETK